MPCLVQNIGKTTVRQIKAVMKSEYHHAMTNCFLGCIKFFYICAKFENIFIYDFVHYIAIDYADSKITLCPVKSFFLL